MSRRVRRLQRSVTNPLRQHPGRVPVGLVRRIQGKLLFGAEPGVLDDEVEIAGRLSAEQTEHLIDVRGEVLLEFGQHVRIAGFGVGRDVADDALAQGGGEPRGVRLEHSSDPGNNPDGPEALEC